MLAEIVTSIAAATGTSHDLAGSWRAVLASPGGELPFTVVIAPPGESPPAVAVNGTERVPFSGLRVDGDRVILEIDWYDAVLDARIDADRRVLTGEWRKAIPGGHSRLPLTAVRDDPRQFLVAPDAGAGRARAGGRWAVTFRDDSGEDEAIAEFVQTGSIVTGTFLTPTGDYRFLEGAIEGERLRLSCFDGAHAFLFDARVRPDGTMTGDFWSRDVYHATWTARRIPAAGEEAAFDPWALTRVTSADGRLRFSVPRVGGGADVTLDDERYRGKVVLVNVFGSWCPNCHDEAPLLARWHREHRARGLEVIGLAFEFAGDPKRDGRVVEAFARRHGIDYPIGLAGVSDKTKAAASLPDLSSIIAYPTTVFIGRDGRVRAIHTGSAGPGTGEHHRVMVREYERLISKLLAEPVPDP